MGKTKYELTSTDNQSFFVSMQKTHVKKNMKVFHKHSHFEVLIINSAHIDSYFITEFGKYNFTSNSVILSRPNLMHRTDRNTKNSVRYILCFKRSFIEPIARFIDVDVDMLFSKCVLNYTESKMREIVSIVNSMIKEFSASKNYEQNKELRILIALFLYRISKYESVSDIIDNEQNVIATIYDFLKYNYAQNITLKQLSERFHINEYELCRKIKKNYGCTVKEIITNVRINKAKELMEDTDLLLADIAERVGYNSYYYFCKRFKLYTGYMPTEYRNKVKKR